MMRSVWDTAEMLIAMAGAEEAVAVARALAAEAVRRREQAFWREVAAAAAVLANPQPLIAPELPPAPEDVVRAFAAHPRAPAKPAPGAARPKPQPRITGAQILRLERAAAKLPTKRASVLSLKRKLRAVWKRHQTKGKPKGPGAPKKG